MATNLSAGTYTVTVTDSAGCFQIFTIVVPGAPLPAATVASQTNVLCYGGNTGSASVSVSAGTSPYTYVWSPSGGNNATATGLTAGTYTILVTDSNGCTDIDTLTISEPPAISLTTSSTQSTCAAPTGTATVTPSGGTPGYSFNWNNNQTTQTATGLPGGTYTVTVTDANGCTMTTTVSVSSTTGPAASAGPDVIIAPGNSVLLTATGGGTYLWSTGETNSSILVSPSADTTYCVTVFDANLCSDTACVKVFVETPCPSN